jgi:hypothetical protein
MNRIWGALVFAGGLMALTTFASPPGFAKAYEGGVGLVQDVYSRPPIRQGGFEVDVLVNGYPLEAIYGRSRRYVEAIPGEGYELRVRNPLPVRVAVALSVDGLNSIDARHTASWDASKWVIEPYGTIRIRGWQMSSARARRFYFTTERDSYAAKLGRRADIGVISAVFYRERDYRPIVPITPRPYSRRDKNESGRSEPPNSDAERSAGAAQDRMAAPKSGDDGYAATGIGRSVDHYVTWINMDLVRQPVADISIRYEYRDGLYKLGLLPRTYPENTLERRERARGFEDRRYSPEPR